MQIAELNANPSAHNNTHVTIAGTVRATYTQPFPHFLLEDATGTIMCRPQNSPPWPTAHIEITGIFTSTKTDSSQPDVPLLNEKNRAYIVHTKPCGLNGCEFESTMPNDIAA